MWDGYDSGFKHLPVPSSWEQCELCNKRQRHDDYENWYLVEGHQICIVCAKKTIVIVDKFPDID